MPRSPSLTVSLSIGLVVGVAMLAARTSSAHVRVLSPQSRHDVDEQADPPCGVTDSAPAHVYRYEPGKLITLRWEEYIDHNSHFRISFDASGDDDFVEPQSETDVWNDDTVLHDEIPDEDDGIYEFEVLLPDVTCDACTLQLIMVARDGVDGGFSGNYFACVDFALEGDPLPSSGGDGDADGAGDVDEESDGDEESGADVGVDSTRAGGCGCGYSGPGRESALSGLAMGLLMLARRRRRRESPPGGAQFAVQVPPTTSVMSVPSQGAPGSSEHSWTVAPSTVIAPVEFAAVQLASKVIPPPS